MPNLRSGGAVLDLLPQIGGAVGRFAVDGIDVLRPAPPDTADVLQTGCFPLVPFANRIAHGVFDFRGETVRLPRNFGEHPHALHGQGWRNPWRVAALSSDRAELVYEHAADSWPWDYAARQVFVLAPGSLRISLELTNRGGRAMPASLGFHPYFVATRQTTLTADVGGVWLSDETCIPTQRAAPSHFMDFAHGAKILAAPFVDHCHVGWTGRARIAQPDLHRVVTLEASPALNFLHLYHPANADIFCVEPVSAMPDAIHRAGEIESGLRIVEAGESFAVSMTLSAHVQS